MDPRQTPDAGSVRQAENFPDPVLTRTGLALAGVHPFALGEDGQLDFADPSRLEAEFGAPPGGLSTTRSDWQDRMSAADVRARRDALNTLSWEGAHYCVDYPLRDARGRVRHVRETGKAVAVADGRATLIHGAIIERTDLAESLQSRIWLARHDEATGLLNRAGLCDSGDALAATAARLGTNAALIRLRLTNLGDLRAVYGPDTETRLLRTVSARLSDAVRRPDRPARLSGGDFAVAVIGSDASALADRIESLLTDAPVQTPFGPLALKTATAQANLPDSPGVTVDRLDYLAAELDGSGDYRPAFSASGPIDVLNALENDRISIAFQPIVRAATGEVAHHECLLRLRAADGRMVSAGELVMQAERDDLVAHLDRRALALALPHLESHADLHLALNVSAGTISDPEAATDYLEQLASAGALVKRITVEMTETLAVDDPAQAAQFASAVRALGCRFAIDDFGSGHTTFRTLLSVNADSIKIDGSLVRGIATDTNKQSFMRMMVDLAQTFSVRTVAEMVETRSDADTLRHLGVDYLQGWHFGQPAASPVWSRLGD